MKRKFQVAFEEKREGNDFNHVRLICNDVNCTAARSRSYLIHLSNSSLTFDFFFFFLRILRKDVCLNIVNIKGEKITVICREHNKSNSTLV